MNLYPLNTFKGETKKELEKMVSKIIDQTKKETREETIMEIEELIDNEYIIKDIYKNSDDLLNDIKKELNKLKK